MDHQQSATSTECPVCDTDCGIRITSHPGWAYDAVSGVCLGPASYEQAEAFRKMGGVPLTENRHGYPHRVVIRERKT